MKKYFFLLFIIISVNDPVKGSVLEYHNLESLKEKKDHENLAGDYKLFVDGVTYDMKISIRCNKPKARITLNDRKISSKFSMKKNVITISLNRETIYVKLVGKTLNATGTMGGVAIDSNGKQSEWSAAKLINDNRPSVKSKKSKI